MSRDRPVAPTPFGKLVGRHETDLNVFRGVRYALPPVGSRRFSKPVPLPLSDAEVDAGTDGTIPPQLPSRLEIAMGPSPAAQGEDCLTLTIWAPAELGAEKVPVLVWFHGGAFVSGAGSLAWYSGAELARTGRIVVVSVNSRLGALGYLRLPGVSEGNLGLHDQLESLRWVQKCIGAIGGDANAVTISGQSAGAYAALALAVHPEGRSLFRSAILQSGPYELNLSAAEADERGKVFAKALGLKATRAAFEDVAVDKLLTSGVSVVRHFSRDPGDITPPFMPCIDADLIKVPLLESAVRGEAAWCDMIVGYTREECTVFAALDPALKTLTREQLAQLLKLQFGDATDALVTEYEALRGCRDSVALFADATTDLRFVAPALRLAQLQAKAGRSVYLYQFDWPSPHTGFGANHCIELPFLFGDREAWSRAPMFKGAADDDYEHIGRTMRGYWGTFVRAGDPNKAGMLLWPAYNEPDRMTMVFNRYLAPMSDPAGGNWRLPFQS